MSHHATVFGVLIASPGDVPQERDAIEAAIHAWNGENSAVMKAILLPLRWETDAVPEMGSNPQVLINKQLVDKADILIAVFWHRTGTPTGQHVSGSVEEVTQFVASGRPTSLYFSTRDIPQGQLDVEQYKVLCEFKDSCKSNGIVKDFDTLDGLKTQVLRHLSSHVRNLLDGDSDRGVGAPPDPPTPHGSALAEDLRRLAERVDLETVTADGHSIDEATERKSIDHGNDRSPGESVEDVGLLDLADEASDAMAAVMTIVSHLTVATERIGQSIQQRADQLEELRERGHDTDRKQTKPLIDAVAADLDTFTEEFSAHLEPFASNYAKFSRSLVRLALIATDVQYESEDVAEVRDGVAGLSSGIDDARKQLVTMRQAIKRYPRLTTKLNKSKRRAVEALETLDHHMQVAVTLNGDIQAAYAKLLEEKASNV